MRKRLPVSALMPADAGSGGRTGSMPVIAYVGMGANLGDAVHTLRAAAEDIAKLPGVLSTILSPLYRSAPVDATGPDFINGVLKLETTLAAERLLQQLQATEHAYGRQRPYRNAPRSLDLDLLIYGTEQRQTDYLTLPHPRMHERAFVLMPLRDLAPGMHLTQGNLDELLAACGDQLLSRI